MQPREPQPPFRATQWHRVSQKTPCKVCGKPDWCTFLEDGTACCMRVASDKQARNGGYIHKSQSDRRIVVHRSMPPPRPIKADSLISGWKDRTTGKMIEDYASELGVDPVAVEALGAAFAPEHEAWAWPMMDGSGRVCGVRLRSDDAKWAVRGSRAGLFIPFVEPSRGVEAVICEGPTDTAAALTLGYWAMGRPSCQGQIDIIRETCRRLGLHRVVIMADYDDAKTRPTGEQWFPGRDGARVLAREIGLPAKLVLPNAKDIRAWLRDGATREDVDCIINNQVWKRY